MLWLIVMELGVPSQGIQEESCVDSVLSPPSALGSSMGDHSKYVPELHEGHSFSTSSTVK